MTATLAPPPEPSARGSGIPSRSEEDHRGALAGRVAAATLACIGRFGLSKLTVDDIARAAGCSRATLYRAYPSKRALVDAAITVEAARVTGAILGAAADAPTLADAITDVIVVGARALHASDALQFVAEHEPELLHPHLSFGGGDRFLALAAARLAPAFARWTPDPVRVAEWTTRVGLCLLWFPQPLVDVADRAAVHAYVTAFVVPGLAPAPSSPLEAR